MINIAILEDQPEVAELIGRILDQQPDMKCRQIYHSAEKAIQSLQLNFVHILIVDIGLPGMSGIEAMIQIHRLCPAMEFCMFTIHEDDENIFQAIMSGAKGYILKSDDIQTFPDSIRELINGGSPISPGIARRVLDQFKIANNPTNDHTKTLPITKQEMIILKHLSEGLLYKEIAELLGISIGTVKQHVHKIYTKLQVQNRTEAINKLQNR